MKIIEAMKRIKDLNIKCQDLIEKIKDHCADLDYESPLYPDMKGKVDGWLQSHDDSVQEILRLRVAIQRTNLATEVTIELGGKQVTKSIAAWIHRRRDLAGMDLQAWRSLGDRGLQEGQMRPTVEGAPGRDVKIRRYFDPEVRDVMVEMYRSEPSVIDGHLEVVNAVTDLVE